MDDTSTLKPIHLGTRFAWMVVVPTVFCFAVWPVIKHGGGVWTVVLAGVLPLVGLLCVPAYRYVWRDYVNWWPYLVPALGSIGFAVSMIYLAQAMAVEPNGAFIPVVQLGLGFLLPFVTLLCSLGSYCALGMHRRPVN